MKKLNFASIFLAIAALSAVFHAQHHHGAEKTDEADSSKKSNLLDEFGKLPHCDLTGRYDVFLAELSQNPASQGYVLIYQGADSLPANYDSPPAERMFRNHVMFRGFDPARVTIINGGFQEEGKTQLWIVPLGAVPPTPESTVQKPEIPTKKTFLFDRGYLAIEEEDPMESEYLLPSVKAELEAERKRWEEENRLERIAAGENDIYVESPGEENESEADSDDLEGLSEEEKVELKFNWLSESFGTLLAERPDSQGVMIFYADDQRFDTKKIQSLIADGIERLGKSPSLKAGRIKTVFGGYRNSTNVEYWVLPKEGKEPVPTPEERPVEEVESIPGDK